MISFLYFVHVLLCFILVLIVLMQAGKGSGVGLSIGGGMSQTMFGGSGGKTFFMKWTIGFAAAFMLTSILLAISATKGGAAYHGVLSGSTPAGASAPAGAPAAPAGQPSAPAPASKPVVPQPK